MKFQLLTESKILKNNEFFPASNTHMLINVTMSTIVGILNFMSRINFNILKNVLSLSHLISSYRQIIVEEF